MNIYEYAEGKLKNPVRYQTKGKKKYSFTLSCIDFISKLSKKKKSTKQVNRNKF